MTEGRGTTEVGARSQLQTAQDPWIRSSKDLSEHTSGSCLVLMPEGWVKSARKGMLLGALPCPAPSPGILPSLVYETQRPSNWDVPLPRDCHPGPALHSPQPPPVPWHTLC